MGIIADVETILRASGKPYIAVDAAKKALFAGAKLKSFHYVAYMPTGSHWLVSCGRPSPDTRADMKQWGEIFGDGFMVVYALKRKAGIVFRGPGGVYMDLATGKAGLEPPAKPPFVIPTVQMPSKAELCEAGGAVAYAGGGPRTVDLLGRPLPSEPMHQPSLFAGVR